MACEIVLGAFAFENLLLALVIELNGDALRARSFSSPLAELVKVNDPPHSRAGHFLEDSALF